MPRSRAWVFVLAMSAAAAPPPKILGTLAPGKVFRKSIAGGESHAYSVHMNVGDYLHVVANQKGVLVYLRLVMPEEKAAVLFLSSGYMEPESVHWISQVSGTFRLEVRPADAHARRGRYELRVEALRRATDGDGDRWQAEMSCLFAIAAEGKGKNDEAVQYYQKALELFGKLHVREREADILLRSGSDRMDLLDFEQSARELESAAKIYAALGDAVRQARALVRLGVDYRLMRRFDDSTRVLEESLAIRVRLKDRVGQAESLDRLGLTWSVQDRYDKAIRYYQDALALDRKIKAEPVEVARELNNLAVIYAFLNQNQRAIDLLDQALAALGAGAEPEQISAALNSQGAIYENMEDFPRAVEKLEKALKIFSGNYLALANLGSTREKMSEPKAAVGLLQKSIGLARAAKDLRSEGAALNLLGKAYRQMGEYDEAIRCHERARITLRAAHSAEFEAMSLEGLMLCWKAKARPRTAIFYGKQSVNLLQSVRAHFSSLDRELQESFLKGNNQRPYRELAELLISQQRLLEAEQVLDLLKVSEYRTYVRRETATAPGGELRVDQSAEEADAARRDAQTADRLMALGVERGTLTAKASLNPAEKVRLKTIDGELEEANRQFESSLERLEKDPGVGPDKVKALREQQALMEDLKDLPPGTVAIYTLVTERKYLAILITPEAEKEYEYAISTADLNRTILEYRQALQNPNLDPRPLAQKLYGVLIGKMAADLAQAKAQTLMWSLDGSLRYVPLAALYDGKQYLIEKYRVSVITPASNARLKDRPTAKWQVLGMGVTKEQKDAPALPEVASELKGIVEQSSGGGVMPGEIVLDEQFTEASMRSELRKRYPVVHIASHFQFQPGDEENSFLLLGDGGRFTISALKRQTNLFSGVQLLTLSACSTGVSETNPDGTEVEGFGVLAQREGARSVIASLWSVADVSTSLMMRMFYQARQAAPDATKLEALRDAQLALLRGSLHADGQTVKRALVHPAAKGGPAARMIDAPEFHADPKAPYAHPYYWAAFYLMGNWL